MNSRIVVLLALFALVPFVLGRNLGFWRLFDEPGKWNAKNDYMLTLLRGNEVIHLEQSEVKNGVFLKTRKTNIRVSMPRDANFCLYTVEKPVHLTYARPSKIMKLG